MKAARLFTLFLALSSSVYAQNPPTNSVPFELDSTSSITIKGTSTVNSFSCISESILGEGVVSRNQAASDAASLSAKIESPVESFDCGNGRMTKDLQKALKSKEYPTIRYELDAAMLERADSTSEDVFRINAHGRLTIAGSVAPIEILLTATRVSQFKFDLTGTQDVLMTDFGVEPPVALFGLVKAHDQITIHFNLISLATKSQ